MINSPKGAWLLAGCIAMGGLLSTAGCSGCSNREAPAPQQTETGEAEAPAETAETPRVLEPEEPPLNEVDAELREALRENELVLRLFDTAPRLTHEMQQETPRATITVYKAETLERELRLRALWTMEADGIQLTGIDVQHREGAAYQREWNAGA